MSPPVASAEPDSWRAQAASIGRHHDAVEATSRDVTLTVYIVRSWVGEPVNRAPSEHQEIGWFTAASLVGLPLANERLGWFLHDVLGSW